MEGLVSIGPTPFCFWGFFGILGKLLVNFFVLILVSYQFVIFLALLLICLCNTKQVILIKHFFV